MSGTYLGCDLIFVYTHNNRNLKYLWNQFDQKEMNPNHITKLYFVINVIHPRTDCMTLSLYNSSIQQNKKLNKKTLATKSHVLFIPLISQLTLIKQLGTFVLWMALHKPVHNVPNNMAYQKLMGPHKSENHPYPAHLPASCTYLDAEHLN